MKSLMRSHGQESVLFALLLVFFGIAFKLDPQFLSMKVQGELIKLVSEMALLALPMTMIVLTGGIDLSVGASMSLSAVVFGLLSERGASWPLAALASVATGTAAGMLNGLIVSKARIHPLIVTLATMSAFFGVAEGVSHARPISGFAPGFQTAVGGVFPFVVVVLCALAALVWLANTVLGQAVFAIGLNEKASRYSSVPVDKIKFLLYSLAGSAAGMSAIFYAARRNTVKADIGHGIELDVVTAVVLGGTSIIGGRGTVWGTLLGVFLVHEVRQFVSWHWERDEVILIVIGSLLILALVANSLLNRRTERAK